MVALPEALRRLRTEWRENRRARLGVAGIALLAALAAWTQLDAMAGRLRDAAGQQRQRLERLDAVRGESAWPARVRETAALRAALEARAVAAESEGAAIADFADTLTAAGREAGLASLQVRVEIAKPADLPADYRRLTASLGGAPTEKSLTLFLDKLEHEPRLISVQRLSAQMQPAARLEISLTTLVRIKAS